MVDSDAALSGIDKVAPFEVPITAAVDAVRRDLAGRFFAPKAFRELAKDPELEAVLVPTFAFQARAESAWKADLGYHYQETETYTTTDSEGRTVTRTRTVTKTEWNRGVTGHWTGRWFGHLVSASRGLPEHESNELEPFDLEAARPFSAELLAGLTAESPSVPLDEAHATAREELESRCQEAVRGHLSADQVSALRVQTRSELESMSVVLLPVWIGHARVKGEDFRVLVNGQTSEVVMEVPLDYLKIALVVIGVLMLIAAIGFGLHMAGVF